MEYKGYKIVGEFMTESRIFSLDENGYTQDELSVIDLDIDEPTYYGIILEDDDYEWFDSMAELKMYVDEELTK